MPDADAEPEDWSSRDKFAAVLETVVLNEADLGEYCRNHPIVKHISLWDLVWPHSNEG